EKLRRCTVAWSYSTTIDSQLNFNSQLFTTSAIKPRERLHRSQRKFQRPAFVCRGFTFYETPSVKRFPQVNFYFLPTC
ncbi:MAG: hypothetical protein LBT05_16040, partial [Planctomycetaceae bacterium]|nr:hypothetical protein [Planctomycetaceae bacterium]